MIVRNVNIADKELFYDSCGTVISYLAQNGRTVETDRTEGTGKTEETCTPALSPALPSVADLLFFDIETTGLSSRESSVYLIGCMYDSEEGPVLTQLLAESPSEEPDIISAFDEIVQKHGVAVHYNGTTFDVPFLSARAEHCGVVLRPFISQIDVYKELKPAKALLSLKSMRLKAVEEYVGIRRQDLYDGGELIELYIKYVSLKKLENLKWKGSVSAQAYRQERPGSKIVSSFSDHTGLRTIGSVNCSELLRILLLHNYEDIENLLPVSMLLNVAAFMKGAFELSSVTTDDESVRFALTPHSGTITDIFTKLIPSSRTKTVFHAHTPSGDDKTVSCAMSDDGSIIFGIETAETELKLFFPDYKNYYYLKYEDYAIHKSIGQFMDRERCVKCTVANCYTRKQGAFIPVFAKKGGTLGDKIYLYRRSAPDKSLFAEVKDLAADREAAVIYVLQLLNVLL